MRQDDREAAALSCARLRTDVTSVGFRHTLDDRQTQAAPAPISVCLSVGVEDGGQRLGGKAHASILDLELELGARIGKPHEDTPAARSKSDRVGAKGNYELV